MQTSTKGALDNNANEDDEDKSDEDQSDDEQDKKTYASYRVNKDGNFEEKTDVAKKAQGKAGQLDARGVCLAQQADRILPGDRLCDGCGAHNFARRTACIGCGRPLSDTRP